MFAQKFSVITNGLNIQSYLFLVARTEIIGCAWFQFLLVTLSQLNYHQSHLYTFGDAYERHLGQFSLPIAKQI